MPIASIPKATANKADHIADPLPIAVVGEDNVVRAVHNARYELGAGRAGCVEFALAHRFLAGGPAIAVHVAEKAVHLQDPGLGEVVRDRYEAVISPDAPIESNYRYWLGWYLGATGQRLPAGIDDKYTIQP